MQGFLMKVNTGPVTELEFSAGLSAASLKNNLKHSTVLLWSLKSLGEEPGRSFLLSEQSGSSVSIMTVG
jgi:hypothetical protein